MNGPSHKTLNLPGKSNFRASWTIIIIPSSSARFLCRLLSAQNEGLHAVLNLKRHYYDDLELSIKNAIKKSEWVCLSSYA